MNLFTEYSLWWSVPCLMLGGLFAFLLYRNETKLVDLGRGLKSLLAILRTLVIAGIAFLLLGPFFKYVERQVQKPIVLIAQDNSSSITMAPDSGFYKNQYLTELNSLSLKLEEEYEIQRYTFDSDLDNSFEIDYSGKQSDISKAINDMMDRNVNRNVGAVILASDGIFNRGVSPSFLASDKGVPIYTVALGDTTIRRDLLIENIARNRLAYLGNDFPVEIQIRADRLKGKNAVLRIRKDGEVLFKRTIEIDDASFVRTIPALLNAKNIGRQRYDVSLSPLAGELTEANNFSSFYIDILDSRQKVLMVYKSPHPDIAAIRNSIESNENYEVVMRSTSDFSGDLSQFDLLITHGLPDASGSAGNLLERARDKNLPIWAIGGVAISWKDAQQAGFGIEARLKGGSNTTDASPSLVRNFSLFSLSEEVSTAITNWAPIKTSFAEFFSEPSARILFEQRIGVVDTDQPLWIFSEVEGYKSSLTIGEGIWRWRIQNFAERGDFSAFDELVSRTVQYLATKEDRRQFRVYGKDKFDEDQNVILEAELYNKSYQAVNDPEVEVRFTDKNGNAYDFVFSRTQTAYYLDAGKFPPGQYAYTAKVSFEGRDLLATGNVTVEAILIESVRTTADHQLLFKIAESSGASMFYPNQLEELTDVLLSKEEIVPIMYSTEQMTDLIESRWLLFLFVAFLAIEWFIRKYKGAY